jgi:hypothetical protein
MRSNGGMMRPRQRTDEFPTAFEAKTSQAAPGPRPGAQTAPQPGDAPPFLDGMKVLFDRKVALYPVELRRRGESVDGEADNGPAPS